MTGLNKGRVGLLVAALRSGLYAKGTGALHTVKYGDHEPFSGTWCCLGVAGDVARRFGLDVTSAFDGTSENPDENETQANDATCELEVIAGNDSYMALRVAGWYGFGNVSDVVLDTEDGDRLLASEYNDKGSTTFEDVARAFELTFLEGK